MGACWALLGMMPCVASAATGALPVPPPAFVPPALSAPVPGTGASPPLIDRGAIPPAGSPLPPIGLPSQAGVPAIVGAAPPASGRIPPFEGVGPTMEGPADPGGGPADRTRATTPSALGRQGRGEARSPDLRVPRARPTLRLTALVTLGAEYRDNVRFVPDGDGDVAVVATPELHVHYRTERVGWKTAYRRIAEAYLRDTALTTANRWQGVDTALEARLTSRVGTTVEAAWRDIHDPTFEILAGATTPASTRVAYQEWAAGNTWNARLSKVLDVTAAYRLLSVEFSESGALSRREEQAEAGARIRLTPHDAVRPQYRFQRLVAETGPEVRIRTAAGGYERVLTRRSVVRMGVGLAWLDGGDLPSMGYTLSVDVEHRQDASSVKASYVREFAALNGLDGVYLTHGMSLTTARRFSRDVDVSLSAHYRWQEEIRSGAPGATYETGSAQVGFSKKASDWLWWRATSSVVRQTTSPVETVVWDARVLLSATMTVARIL